MQYKYDELNEFGQWLLCKANASSLDAALLSYPDSDRFEIAIHVNGVDVGIDFDEVTKEIDVQLDNIVATHVKAALENEVVSIVEQLLELKETISKMEIK